MTFITICLFILANVCYISAFSLNSSNSSLANAPYKDASLPVDTRVQDLLSRMTIEEKTAQLLQGDISNWLNTTSGGFNYSGLVENFDQKAGMFVSLSRMFLQSVRALKGNAVRRIPHQLGVAGSQYQERPGLRSQQY